MLQYKIISNYSSLREKIKVYKKEEGTWNTGP